MIVTVGDYIDRGDYSADVLAFLMAKASAMPNQWVCLRGNHEEMMLDFLDDPERYGRQWLKHGGLQTLASFRVYGVTHNSDKAAMLEARDTLRTQMPDHLELWLRSLPLSWHSGNLWVVHAAADPKRAMQEQKPSTLTWGTRDFFKVPRRDGIWVAHGHTVIETPCAENGRIGIDTGAYYTGTLTAARCSPSGKIAFTSNLDD